MIFERFRLAEYRREPGGTPGSLDDLRILDPLLRPFGKGGSLVATAGCHLHVRGWSIEPRRGGYRLLAGIVVTVGEHVAFEPPYGRPRPDIAAEFGDPALANAGFRGAYPLGDLPAGAHRVTAYAVAHDCASYYELPGSRDIEIVASRALFPSVPLLDGSATIAVDALDSMHALGREATHRFARRDTLVVRGHAHDAAKGVAASGVYAIVDGERYVCGVHGLPNRTPDERPERSAFTVRIVLGGLVTGKHELRIAALASDGASYALGAPVAFRVSGRA